MKYDEIIEYLKKLPPFIPVKKDDGSLLFDLDTVSELASRLDAPQDMIRCVHIAGTNGKGSAAEFLTHILIESGYRVGTFTSPYLTDMREQIKVDGKMIPEERLGDLFESIIPVAEDMKRESSCLDVDKDIGLRYKAPSEFEMTVVAAFLYFYRCKCDICIIEAGLGGEYDATNILSNPLLCLFTNISIDHTAVLGDTLESIAGIKAGIIKPGCECISVQQKEEVNKVLRKRAAEKGVSFQTVLKPSVSETDLSGLSFDTQFEGRKHTFRLSVSGSYQAVNASLAIYAAERLRAKGFKKIFLETVRSGLLLTKRKGRFEVLSRKPPIIADGAHNDGGVKALLESLKEVFPQRYRSGKGFVFIAGVMADKDYNAFLGPVIDRAFKVYTVTPDNVRAMPAKALANVFKSMGADAEASADVKEALLSAIETAMDKDMPVVAFGSLYYIGELIECVEDLRRS